MTLGIVELGLGAALLYAAVKCVKLLPLLAGRLEHGDSCTGSLVALIGGLLGALLFKLTGGGGGGAFTSLIARLIAALVAALLGKKVASGTTTTGGGDQPQLPGGNPNPTPTPTPVPGPSPVPPLEPGGPGGQLGPGLNLQSLFGGV